MNKKQLLIGAMTAIVVIFLASGIVVEKRLSDLRDYLDNRIAEQVIVVSATALALAKNTTDEVFSEIVPECSVEDSTVYDTLLSSLDKGLSTPELTKLDTLFEKCGSVTARRRVGMSSILNSQNLMLQELSQERALLGEYSSESNKIEQFQELADTEQEISLQFMKLVQAQGQIITTLQANIPSTAVSVETIRAEAQSVREELERLTVLVTTLRSDLF